MTLVIATLQGRDIPDYEAPTLHELKSQIAQHFVDAGKSARVHLNAVEYLNDDGETTVSVNEQGLRLIELDIEGMIIGDYAAQQSYADMVYSATPKVLQGEDMKITTQLCPNGEYYAIDADEYDGAPDSGSPQGWGKTEWEAVADLANQFVDIEQARSVYKKTQAILAEVK